MEDRVQVSVKINGKQGINELGKLELEANQLTHAIKKMKEGTDEYAAANQKLKTVQQRIDEVRNKLGLTGMTLQQMVRFQRELQNQITRSTTRGTADYEKLRRELVAVNQQIARQRMSMRGATGLWNSLGKGVKQFGALALGYLGLTTLTSQLQNLIHRAGEFSDRLGQVRKTTGLTAEEVEQLNAELKAIDTRTARSELLSMAKIAGKLGITAKNDILGFVAAADKINVALGEDLGDPEQSMRKLGKLIETFKVKEVYGIEDAMLKVGSAINHLGKSSTANEGYIVEFTKRMGGIAPLAKVTIQDILGLAAASDALGLTQEVSTTALSKLFIKMTSNREVFAQYTKDINGNKLSLEQYSHLIDTDFNEAFLSLLRGVKDNSQGMIALTETLDDLEQDGGRVVQVLGTLSNNTRLISEQQKISNEEFDKGTSVLNEFNLMNETLGAKLDRIKKALFAAFVNSSLVAGLEKIAGWFDKMLKTPLSQKLEKDRIAILAMGLELKAANTSLERRKTIIDELSAQFPGYFDNISAENLEYDKLDKALEKVNKLLVDKIVIQKRDEEIGEKAAEAAEVKNDLLETEGRLREKLAQIASREGKALPAGEDIIEQYNKLKESFLINPPSEFRDNSRGRGVLASYVHSYERQLRELNELNGELEGIQKDRDDLFKRLFGDDQPVKKKTVVPDPVVPDGSGGNGKVSPSQKSLEKSFQYQTIALKEARAEGLITEEQYRADLLALEITHLTAMIEARKFLGEDTADLEEKLADKKIEAIDRVEKAEQSALKKSKQANKERIIEIEEGINALASSMANIFGLLSDLSNQSTEEGIQNALRWSNAQVIAAQASALANAIAGASAAAAATGPGAPFVLAGYIASMVGTIIAAFAQIRQNQRSASDAKENLRKDRSGRGRYHGGDSPSSGLGFGDENGEYTGYTHANEFVVSEARMKRGPQVVIPSYTSSPSKVVDLTAINSTIAKGFSFSGSMSSSLDSNSLARMESAADRMEQAQAAFAHWVSVLLSKPISAQFGNRAFEDGIEEYERKESNRAKGSLRQ